MKRTKVQDVIERFLDGGYEVAKVTDWHHCSPNSCYLSLSKAAKTYGYRVIVRVINREVYLFKEE